MSNKYKTLAVTGPVSAPAQCCQPVWLPKEPQPSFLVWHLASIAWVQCMLFIGVAARYKGPGTGQSREPAIERARINLARHPIIQRDL